jgi:hypothetical protein
LNASKPLGGKDHQGAGHICRRVAATQVSEIDDGYDGPLRYEQVGRVQVTVYPDAMAPMRMGPQRRLPHSRQLSGIDLGPEPVQSLLEGVGPLD